ncbi:DcrB-related protein [Metapseudomonas otitidis]|uniref:DcrB-related protein n=1 Tax=Metapseudomonas otitidis TaxID=319939 RepID=UPI0013F5BA4B|nr:DUF1795 domain-containing protein [Pseudomonas otitidis]
MDYRLHEGQITLPTGFQDRTVNMFIPGSVVPAPFSLTIARDTTLPGEALTDYIERQVGLIAAKLRKYKRHGTSAVQLGTQAPIAGIQIDANYQSDGRTIYQRQAAFLIATDRALVFSGTSQTPFDDAMNQMWADVLASYRAHPPVASNP